MSANVTEKQGQITEENLGELVLVYEIDGLTLEEPIPALVELHGRITQFLKIRSLRSELFPVIDKTIIDADKVTKWSPGTIIVRGMFSDNVAELREHDEPPFILVQELDGLTLSEPITAVVRNMESHELYYEVKRGDRAWRARSLQDEKFPVVGRVTVDLDKVTKWSYAKVIPVV